MAGAPRKRRAPRLAVQGLQLASEQQFGTDLKDISFAVAGGEILGIGGIAGNGQNELMAALSGEALADRPEAILIDGKPVGRLGPGQRRSLGRRLRAGGAQRPWRGARHEPDGECLPQRLPSRSAWRGAG